MNLKHLKENWKTLGKEDPFWAVLTNPKKRNNKWDKEDFFRTGKREVNRLLNYFSQDNKINYGRVIDFGCGPGRLTQSLAKHFDKVIGMDISSTMIDHAKELNSYPLKCQYLVNETADLNQLESESFDLVFSYITLQHIEPQYITEYLKEFVRITKKGAYILFNLPSQPPRLYRLLYSTIGSKGLNMLRRIYYQKSTAIEMHWIPHMELTQMMSSFGAELISSVADQEIGKNWESSIYFFQKE